MRVIHYTTSNTNLTDDLIESFDVLMQERAMGVPVTINSGILGHKFIPVRACGETPISSHRTVSHAHSYRFSRCLWRARPSELGARERNACTSCGEHSRSQIA